jgi:hypothetical protein
MCYILWNHSTKTGVLAHAWALCEGSSLAFLYTVVMMAEVMYRVSFWYRYSYKARQLPKHQSLCVLSETAVNKITITSMFLFHVCHDNLNAECEKTDHSTLARTLL